MLIEIPSSSSRPGTRVNGDELPRQRSSHLQARQYKQLESPVCLTFCCLVSVPHKQTRSCKFLCKVVSLKIQENKQDVTLTGRNTTGPPFSVTVEL